MKMYRFRADAKDQIDYAGVTQAAIARGAGYDRHVLNRKIAQQANVRPAIANRIARAFGQSANMSQDAALAVLFEEISVAR
jgi:plasmid maintenance system antidote protein VapI